MKLLGWQISKAAKDDIIQDGPQQIEQKAAPVPSSEMLVVDPRDNEIMRALMAFASGNQVVHYQSNNATYIDKGYTYNPHIYTVIGWIARNIAQVPFYPCIVKDQKEYSKYIRLKEMGTDRMVDALVQRSKALERVDTGNFANLFISPNDDQTWDEFSFEWSGFEELTGASYIYGQTPAGYDEDLFAQLFIPPSQLMQIITGGWMEPIKGYKLMYSRTQGQYIGKEKILMTKNWNPRHDMMTGKSLYGMSPLDPLLRTLKRSNESVDGSLALLVNGNPGGVLSNDSERALTSPERKEAQKDFDSRFGGGVNLNRILLASTKVSWQQIGLSSVDLELLESDKIDFGTMCRAYGLDEIIFNPDKSSYNNKITAQKAAWQDTLIPKLNRRKSALTKWLCPGWSKEDNQEYVIDYDISAIPCLQADLKLQVERLEKEFAMGMHSPNDLRIAQGLDIKPDENMDKHYMDNRYHELGAEVKNPVIR